MKQQKTMQNMSISQIRAVTDALDEKIKICDQDIQKMLVDCQHLKDESFNETHLYHKK